MSSSTNNEPRFSLSPASSAHRLSKHVLPPVRALSFWVAVALPFLYLPLLATGLTDSALTGAFLLLLVCNACALLLGHSHLQE